MNRKAIIVGIKKFKLTREEKFFFKREKPWGVILFSRNIRDISQLKKLVKEIRKTINDKYYPIMIDQEGGKVSRLKNLSKFNFYSQGYFGDLYLKDKKLFLKLYKEHIDKICLIFKKIGININTVPVSDVKRKKSHKIIGSRAFSENPNEVSYLSKLCIENYKKNKIGTVIKHIPGIGLSNCDSHFKTPVIKLSKKDLIRKDFKPFKKQKSHFAMTGHAIYRSYDPKNTATHSKVVISDVIRNIIKFKGILISDDISMKALKYNLEKNAIKALEAGCNLVLHCNGKMNEMNKIIKFIPKIDSNIKKKTSHFYKFLR